MTSRAWCRQVQSETLFPVEEVHLEEDFFSEFTYTNALLTAEVRLNLLALNPEHPKPLNPYRTLT